MKEKLLAIRENALQALKESRSLEELETLRIKILGKKGELTQILRGMGQLQPEERPLMGKLTNEVREEIEEALELCRVKLDRERKQAKVGKERIDITRSVSRRVVGHRHPIHQTMEALENFFQTMGFTIVDGPEIETVENNFDRLNSPKDHPSRDLSDTFYLDPKTVLRTHTSPVQIRTMMTEKPPIRIVSAGRTFRFDDVDDTHSPMFHQIEGLVVDEHVTMANLIALIDRFIKEFFGVEMKTRFRPHYFPFTEPSAEVDVSCFLCKGKGCPACHGTGWSMELLGCGMVHPKVLENCGIDSKKYAGFAFGMGVDRITMVRHGIDNIRLLYDNDKRFLEQF